MGNEKEKVSEILNLSNTFFQQDYTKRIIWLMKKWKC